MRPSLAFAIFAPILVGAWHLNLALLQAITTLWDAGTTTRWIAILVGPASTLPAVALAFKATKAGAYWLIVGGILSFALIALVDGVGFAGYLRYFLQVSAPMIATAAGLLYFFTESWWRAEVLGMSHQCAAQDVRSTADKEIDCATDAYWKTIRSIARRAVLLHALAILIVWIFVFELDIDVISTRAWLILAWVWPIWAFAIFGTRSRLDVTLLIPFSISAALLSPCVGTVYVLTNWLIWGFAP
jgi:hypothetical protein